MTDVPHVDALIRGDISPVDYCKAIAAVFTQSPPPPPGSRAVTSWNDFEWFWMKLSDPIEEAPGEWAVPHRFDISADVSPDEDKVWGSGVGEFYPTAGSLGQGCYKLISSDQVEMMKNISRGIHVGFKQVVAGIEALHQQNLDYLYSDPEEARQGNVSKDLVKRRRAGLLEAIEGMINATTKWRVALPFSNGLPNQKIMEAFQHGWIPIGYVGPLKTGSAVVFHPAHKSRPSS